ncbi:hypothetical protein ACTMSW_09560 [Micromonospora sp. BQ11]|uniref:hypothetical protein n=1 Tax=Micromonospora sp. BQ11 TaxID=3452212 RepID=UPI003F8B1289
MTTVRSTAPRHTVTDAPAGGLGEANAATLALARVENWRLLRHPIVLTAVTLVLTGWIVPAFTGSVTRFPVLYAEDSALLFEMTLIAAAVMIAANLAVLRTHRHGVTVFTDVLVLPAWRRTLAHLLSLLPSAAVAGILAVARIAQLGLQSGAAGSPDPLQLAVAPALVLLFGAVGVLLGSLVRSTVVVPVLLVLLLFFWLFRPPFFAGSEKRLSWLSPVELFPGDVGPGGLPPVQLMYEPAGAHLLYLLALAVLIAVAALLRAGAPAIRTAPAGVLALLVVVASGVAQVQPTPDDVIARRTTMTNEPSRFHDCVQRDTVTYCAFPEFVAWTEAWRRVVDGVRRPVPAERATTPLVVRQRTVAANIDKSGSVQNGASLRAWQDDDRRAGTPEAISVGTQWGTPMDEIGFAVHVAHRVVTGAAIASEKALACGGVGVLTVWLAAQSTHAAGKGLPELLDASSSGRSEYFQSLGGGEQIEIGIREITVAQQLLEQPADRITDVVARSWSRLTAPGTTLEQAAELLGTTAPTKLAPMPPEELAYYGDDFKECG